MKFQQSLISLFIIGTLSACGGSSSSDSGETTDPTPAPAPAPETTNLQGKAADGYLSNANVCLDLNNNKMCDTGEPSSTTGEGGEFTLTGVTQAQIDENPLLVEIIAGETIDEDTPGVVLTQGYTLSAPAGYTFVSPLTTMVQSEVDSGSSVDDAETAVQGKLGTSLSLAEDYVAGADGEDNTAEFQKLHQIAQVTASIIADNMATLEATAESESIPLDELISLVTNEVFDALANITSQVEDIVADESLTFDVDSIATDVDINLESENLADQIAQNEAENSATSVTLVDIIQGSGINWFWSEAEDDGFVALEFGTVKLDNEMLSDIEYEINEEGVTEIRENTPDEGQQVLTVDGWVAENDTITEITLNDNGSITFIMATTALNETVTGTELILDELNVKNILMHTGGDGSWSNTVSETLVFPTGSKAYQLEFSQTNAATPYTFNSGDWCETGDADRWEALNNSCNAVYLNNSWATTLDSLIKESAATSPYTDLTSVSAVIGLADGNIVGEMLTNGTINFYNQNYDNSATKLSSGSWKDITVHNKTLREISVPLSIATFPGQNWSNVNEEDNKLYLTVVDGFVRVAWSEIDDDSEYAFNDVASQYILGNASRDNLPQMFTETFNTVNGTTYTRTFTVASRFTAENAVGIYDMYFDENDSPIVVTIMADGTGSINFGENENGEDDIGQLVWDIADGGSLDFTETASDGEVFEWSIIMVEAFDDIPAKTALIEEISESGEANVILNTFVKR